MKRITIQPRTNWQSVIAEQGFLFNDNDAYWTETAAYVFSESEILYIEKATQEIFDLCCEAVEYVIKREWYERMHIDRKFADLIRWSWYEDQPSLYGRMDLAYHNGQIKLLEFNADTPTSLLESSVIQWYWLQDYNSHADQFNSIHEHLQKHYGVIRPWLKSGQMHFTCAGGNTEDYMTVKYLEDVAQQSGYNTYFFYIDQLGFDTQRNCFVDDRYEPIQTIFKLYPYEWMLGEEFADYLNPTREQCYWIEPAWKMLLSNKMILSILHELFPYSEYILPCAYGKPVTSDYVKKPLFSREGANVEIWKDGKILEATGGEYGEEGFVYQQFATLPDFEGNYPIIGSWIIGGEAAGMGIRESNGLITNNTSRFVPHFFE
jgi:glutathionylspermidine synthase